MAGKKWSMYDIDFFKKPPYNDPPVRLRPNVVRIIPFSHNDVHRLLTAEQTTNIQAFLQELRVHENKRVNVFYGKLDPDTIINIKVDNKWGSEGNAAHIIDTLTSAEKTLIDQLKGVQNAYAKTAGYVLDGLVNGSGVLEGLSGISMTSVGGHTLQKFGNVEFNLPNIKCRYYMPSDVDFAIKSLTDLMRLIYPNNVNTDTIESAIDSITRSTSEIKKAITGYSTTVSPTPNMVQIGHYMDVAPVSITGVDVVPSGGVYVHSIKDERDKPYNISMPEMLEINITLKMFMKMPPSIVEYVWLKLFGNNNVWTYDGRNS